MSKASASISSLRSRSKEPVPRGHSWPSMMFSLTPVMWSHSACMAALKKRVRGERNTGSGTVCTAAKAFCGGVQTGDGLSNTRPNQK